MILILSQTDLNPNQVLQVQSEVNGTSHIDIEEIRNFTNGLNYPLYFLDFETIGPAVPKYNGSRPYQQLVFQYSLHIQETLTSVIEHREYLADPSKDPRIGFIEQLIQDCGSSGDILVYNIGFERGKLNDLIDVFPEYSNELSRDCKSSERPYDSVSTEMVLYPRNERELFNKVRFYPHLFLNSHIMTLILKKEVQHPILFFQWLMKPLKVMCKKQGDNY